MSSRFLQAFRRARRQKKAAQEKVSRKLTEADQKIGEAIDAVNSGDIDLGDLWEEELSGHSKVREEADDEDR